MVNQKTGLGEFLYLSVSDGEGNSKRIDSFKVEDNKKPTIFIVDNDTSKMYSITSSFNNYKIDFFFALTAAATKLTKIGCGFATVLLYSGWYCTPIKKG